MIFRILLFGLLATNSNEILTGVMVVVLWSAVVLYIGTTFVCIVEGEPFAKTITSDVSVFNSLMTTLYILLLLDLGAIWLPLALALSYALLSIAVIIPTTCRKEN